MVRVVFGKDDFWLDSSLQTTLRSETECGNLYSHTGPALRRALCLGSHSTAAILKLLTISPQEAL